MIDEAKNVLKKKSIKKRPQSILIIKARKEK